MQPVHIRIGFESADEAGKIHVEHDASFDVPLHENERRQSERSCERSLIVVELSRQQDGLPVGVVKLPAGYSKHGCTEAASSNFVRVTRMPGLRRGEARLASRIGKNLRHEAAL